MQATKEWLLFNWLTDDFRLTKFRDKATYMITSIPHTGDITRVFVIEHLATGTKTALKICENVNNYEKKVALCTSEHIPQSAVKIHSIKNCVEQPNYISMHMEYGIPLRAYLKTLPPMMNGSSCPAVRRIIHDMGCALNGLHQLGYHHRDVRPENFIICTDGDLARPKLIDFGLAMPRTDRRSSMNNQEFVRPPEFIYCDHTTPEAQILYEDHHDIYALGMTILDILGVTADFRISYQHENALKSIYVKETQLCASRRLAEILNLKPWYQSIRLLFFHGMPPKGHYFYNCDVGRYLSKIYNWFQLAQFSGIHFETALCQEPVLCQFIKQALHWNKSERPQSCKEMVEVHFDLMTIL